jgi:hypothetical protein
MQPVLRIHLGVVPIIPPARAGHPSAVNSSSHAQFTAAPANTSPTHASAGGQHEGHHLEQDVTFVVTDVQGSTNLWEHNPKVLGIACVQTCVGTGGRTPRLFSCTSLPTLRTAHHPNTGGHVDRILLADSHVALP